MLSSRHLCKQHASNCWTGQGRMAVDLPLVVRLAKMIFYYWQSPNCIQKRIATGELQAVQHLPQLELQGKPFSIAVHDYFKLFRGEASVNCSLIRVIMISVQGQRMGGAWKSFFRACRISKATLLLSARTRRAVILSKVSSRTALQSRSASTYWSVASDCLEGHLYILLCLLLGVSHTPKLSWVGTIICNVCQSDKCYQSAACWCMDDMIMFTIGRLWR